MSGSYSSKSDGKMLLTRSRNAHGFLMFSGVRESVHWEQMG